MKSKFALVSGFRLALGCWLLSQTLGLAAVAFAQGATPPPPTRVRAKLDGFELSPKSGKSANQVGGASRDLGSPKLFAPNLGKAFSTTPEFHWSAAEPNGKVTFRLSSEEGQTLYETTTTADSLRYPGDAPALLPGKTYQWTVVPENDVLGGAPKPVSFQIVGGAERDEIQTALKDAPTPGAAADVFVKHHIWLDAVQRYSDLIAKMPDDQDAHRMRAELYDALPVTKPLADADWRMVH
jgi:hypothetical protein